MYLGAPYESATLTVGELQATDIVSRTAGQIEFRVPTDAASGPVIVNMELLKSNDDVTFHLDVPPVVTGIPPAEGSPGSLLTITGRNFGPKLGTVTIGGVRASVQRGRWSETSIVCKPSKKLQAGVHDVTVVTPLGSSTLPGAFTVAAQYPGTTILDGIPPKGRSPCIPRLELRGCPGRMLKDGSEFSLDYS